MPDQAPPDDEKIEKVTEEAEWKTTLQRLGLGEVDITGVSPQDILYLAKQWQFLQVVAIGEDIKPLDEPEFITAKSGWVIHNYGDAMSTSPGRYIFGRGYVPYNEDEDDDDSGGVGTMRDGKGTMIKQAFDSACEIIQLAQQFGWDGAQIVDGHPDMQLAAWVEAVRIGVRLDGYAADVPAELQRRRIEMTDSDMQMIRRAMSAGIGNK